MAGGMLIKRWNGAILLPYRESVVPSQRSQPAMKKKSDVDLERSFRSYLCRLAVGANDVEIDKQVVSRFHFPTAQILTNHVEWT